MKNYILPFLFVTLALSACDKNSNIVTPTSYSSTGQGGSLARFTIAQQHLYVVDDQQLYTYSLTNATEPVLKSKINVDMSVETIYSYADKLFIGSRDAMYVYSIADANNPGRLGIASHVRACDPVVANDTLAYVTVRSGSTCGGTANSLIVYDIKNILNPTQKNAVALQSPYGLGIKRDRLYVCDGANGLKVYDLTNPVYPTLVRTFADEMFMDVITTDDVLICMVQGGTALYKYDAAAELVKLAKIGN